jgi:putative ABC transport system permease protein
MKGPARLFAAGFRRGGIAKVLIGFQLALTLIVCANVTNILAPRIREATRPTGLIEDDAFVVSSTGLALGESAQMTVDEDLRRIRGIPGVSAATPLMGAPLTGLQITATVSASETEEAGLRASLYHVDEQGIDALGVRLISGRPFRHDEVVRGAGPGNASWPSVVITEDLAKALFGSAEALGRTILVGRQRRTTIVGVIERLDGPVARMPSPMRERSMLVPQILTLNRESGFLVRTNPGELQGTMAAVERQLVRADRNRLVHDVLTLRDVRVNAYFPDFAAATVMSGLLTLLVAANAVGIYGMSTFWVVERRRQIAIRRAIGATTGRVVLEFAAEGTAMALAGIVVGTIGAYVVNFWAMHRIETHRLAGAELTAAAFVLALLTIAATAIPAFRASRSPIAPALQGR